MPPAWPTLTIHRREPQALCLLPLPQPGSPLNPLNRVRAALAVTRLGDPLHPAAAPLLRSSPSTWMLSTQGRLTGLPGPSPAPSHESSLHTWGSLRSAKTAGPEARPAPPAHAGQLGGAPWVQRAGAATRAGGEGRGGAAPPGGHPARDALRSEALEFLKTETVDPGRNELFQKHVCE